MGSKEARVIRGLAKVLGLSGDADYFMVLKTAAEAIGCVVERDGTVFNAVRKRHNMHATSFAYLHQCASRMFTRRLAKTTMRKLNLTMK